MFDSIINSKSKTLLALCFSFLLSVFIISLLEVRFDFIYLYVSLFILVFFLIISWPNKKSRFIFLCLFVFILGAGRYLLAFPAQEIKTGQAEFTGQVAVEPDIRADGVRYIVKADFGKIYLKEFLYPRYQYGDELRINCVLQKTEPIENFRYDMYLARYGAFAVCAGARIEKIGEDEGWFLLRRIFALKNIVAEKINRLWHEPYAGFMAGLLYGYRGGLGGLNELFNRTGITHIIAISGYNITIVVAALMAVFVNLRLPRQKSFWLIVAGVVVFILFAGASASVVRAGLMGLIVLLARQAGRLSRVGNMLALTAVLMSLLNPLILVWDAGFQLSFISTLGLVYLSPVLRPWFIRWPEFAGIRESLISTSAAITATLPLILYQFGRLSIVALTVNLLVLWLIPLLMLGGFLAVIFSFIFFPLAQVIAWLSWAGMKYVVAVVEWFSNLKFAAVDLSLPWWAMVAMYGLLLYLVISRQTAENGRQPAS